MVKRYLLKNPIEAYSFTKPDLSGKDISYVSWTFDGVTKNTWFKAQFDLIFTEEEV